MTVMKQLKESCLKKVHSMGASSILVQLATHENFIFDLETFNLVKRINNSVIVSTTGASPLIVMRAMSKGKKKSALTRDASPFSMCDELGKESVLKLNGFANLSSHHELTKHISNETSGIEPTNQIRSNYTGECGHIVKNNVGAAHAREIIGLRRLASVSSATTNSETTVHCRDISVLIKMSSAIDHTGSSHFIGLDKHGSLVTRNDCDDFLFLSERVRFTFLSPFECQSSTILSLIGVSVKGEVYIIHMPLKLCVKGHVVTRNTIEWCSHENTLLKVDKDVHSLMKKRVSAMAQSMVAKFGRFPGKYRLFLWRWLLDPLVEFDEKSCQNILCHRCELSLEIAQSDFTAHSPVYHDQCSREKLTHILIRLIHWDESLAQSIKSHAQVISSFFVLFPNLVANESTAREESTRYTFTLCKLIAAFITRGFLFSSTSHLNHISHFIRSFLASSPSRASLSRCCINENIVQLVSQSRFICMLEKRHFLTLWDHIVTKGVLFQCAFIASVYIKFVLCDSAVYNGGGDENDLLDSIAKQLNAIEFNPILLLADDILHSFDSREMSLK